MTREEAIEYLEDAKYDLPYKFKQALDMAIEALSNQQKWIDEELQNYLIENADLVTCKDCRYYDESCEVCRCPQWDLSRTEYPKVKAHDFCSYGEASDED